MADLATPEQRAALRRAYVTTGDPALAELAAALDEARAELAALRAVAEAARAALDAEDSSPTWWPTLRTLERALRAWEEREP